MWATIIFGSMILVAIIFTIISKIKTDGWGIGLCSMTAILSCLALIVSLLAGYLSGKNLERKNELIKIYEICPCSKHFDDIIAYNNYVEANNNLFWRFKIEDRSEYLIDLDELLK